MVISICLFPAKAFFSILSTLSIPVITSGFPALSKTLSDMVFTPPNMVTLRLVFSSPDLYCPLKAPFSIVLRLLGKRTSVKLLFINASFPICSIPSEIVSFLIFLFISLEVPSNALSPIFLTGMFFIKAGTSTCVLLPV